MSSIDGQHAIPEEFRQRWIPLTGTWNLRDVGGYVTSDGGSIRPFTLIRGDALHSIDDDGRADLRSLGVRTIIDLRNGSERELNPDQVCGIGRSVHLPILNVEEEITAAANRELPLTATYERMIEGGGLIIASVLQELAADDALPGLVHCAAGKDRTGLVIALILSVVGVPDGLVALDYAATGFFLTENRRSEMIAKVTSAYGVDQERAAHLVSSEYAYMIQILAWVREHYGSVANYFVFNGVSPTEIAALRGRLVQHVRFIGIQCI